jgi:hypothetical protein
MDIIAIEIPFFKSDVPDASDPFFTFQSIRELCNRLYDIDRFGDTKEQPLRDPSDSESLSVSTPQ